MILTDYLEKSDRSIRRTKSTITSGGYFAILLPSQGHNNLVLPLFSW
ncbi:MAG: hypothetical protein KME40_30080 [Komarekiella atlantica HA4396-MV6]|nr:hypothetical protein [Komarekiella atlantica HA4396-MV6]